jgi:hypothetical protein
MGQEIVPFVFGNIKQLGCFLEAALKLMPGFRYVFEGLEVPDDLIRCRGILPKNFIRHLRLQLGDLTVFVINVKDTPGVFRGFPGQELSFVQCLRASMNLPGVALCGAAPAYASSLHLVINEILF